MQELLSVVKTVIQQERTGERISNVEIHSTCSVKKTLMILGMKAIGKTMLKKTSKLLSPSYKE